MNATEMESKLIACDADNLPQNVVAAAVHVNNGNVSHAGIFIKIGEQRKIFHYTGRNIVIDNAVGGNWYICNTLTCVNQNLAPAYFHQFKHIAQNAKPIYNYYYDGSYFDENGEYFGNEMNGQFMTCVGFCLNTVKGILLGQDFMSYRDWDSSSVPQLHIDRLIQKIAEINPEVSADKFIDKLRRITPIEYFAAAYIDDLPVRKVKTDAIIEQLTSIVLNAASSAVA